MIDDQASVRLVVSKLLGRLGVSSVESASSGAEAMTLVETAVEPFDVAICDLSMPNEDGLAWLRRLATLTKKPAVVLMSGYDTALLETARRLGESHGLTILAALSKPLTRAALAALLESANLPKPVADRLRSPVLPASDIDEAIEQGRFEVWFQPQYDTRAARVVGMEALLRLRHEAHGVLLPGSFVDLAERRGLVGHLSEHVLEQAAAWAARWQALGHPLSVAVNLSKAGLSDLTLPERAIRICSHHGIPPSQLVFEITESTLAPDATVALDIMARLRLLGFRLSLDDFGTGFATLEELRSLPFHELKLGTQLVQGAVRDSRSRKILENVIALASDLQMSAVAEGIETAGQLELVAGLGCRIVQGYFIARPMPAHAVSRWLSRAAPALGARLVRSPGPGTGVRPDTGATPGRVALMEALKLDSSSSHPPGTGVVAAVSRFAHDVAGPVMVLLGLSEILLEATPPGGELREEVEQIHGAAEEVSALVKALRTSAVDPGEGREP